MSTENLLPGPAGRRTRAAAADPAARARPARTTRLPLGLVARCALPSPAGALGTIVAAATARGLAWLGFDTPTSQGLAALPDDPGHPVLAQLAEELRRYASDPQAPFAVPLDLQGTAFQREVWAALRHIPAGRTCSYADIATAIGRPSAVRAVGLANGANPVAIVVPCHRVIGRDGSLTGYAGGLARKAVLLKHEAARPGNEVARAPAPGRQASLWNE